MKRLCVFWLATITIALYAVLPPTSGGQPQQQLTDVLSPAEAALREDTYGVYSAMLTDSVPLYLVQAVTVPVLASLPPQICLPQTDARDLLTEIGQYRYSPETLEAFFKTAKPVVLLNEMEIGEFIAGFRGQPSQNPKFQGAKNLYRLTHVFFNQKRTMAITQIGMSCGLLCGMGEWKIFEKTNGQWRPFQRPASTPPCPRSWVN